LLPLLVQKQTTKVSKVIINIYIQLERLFWHRNKQLVYTPVSQYCVVIQKAFRESLIDFPWTF